MTFAILLTIGALAGAIIFISPKLGSMLIWPILFMYPHNWWYHHGFFPLNIGADDAFCLLLFVAVVIRRNLLGGVPIRIGYAFWVITAFTVISAVANFVGAQEMAAGAARIEAIKGVLKPIIFWALFYSILHCIDNQKDLKLQFTMFAVSATCGALLVILQRFFPQQMNIFALPTAYEYMSRFTYASRGVGAFTNPNAAACVMGCSLLLSMTALRLQKRIIMKAFIYALIIVLLMGILDTRSRSGLIALISCVFFMLFLGRIKSIALISVLGGLCVAIVFVGARELLGERIAQTYDMYTGVVGENIVGRVDTWWIYLKESSLKDYLLGQGSSTAIAKFGMESHNAYISLLTVYGLGGAIWGMVALAGFVRRAYVSVHSKDPTVSAVAAGCTWALLFWGIYALTSDAISSYYTRYLLFYFVVLVDRAYIFATLSPSRRPSPLLSSNLVGSLTNPRSHLMTRRV